MVIGGNNSVPPRRTRASTTKGQESQLKCSRNDPFNKERPSKWPKYNGGGSHILSLDGTSQFFDLESIIKLGSAQL